MFFKKPTIILGKCVHLHAYSGRRPPCSGFSFACKAGGGAVVAGGRPVSAHLIYRHKTGLFPFPSSTGTSFPPDGFLRERTGQNEI